MKPNQITCDYSVRADGSMWMSLSGPNGQHSQFDFHGTLEQAGLVKTAINSRTELLAACERLKNIGLIATTGRTTDGNPANCTCHVHPELESALQAIFSLIAGEPVKPDPKGRWDLPAHLKESP